MHPNEAMYRSLFAEAAAGDFSKMGEALAEHVVWHLGVAGDPIVGKEAVVAAMTDDMAGVTFGVALHDVLANDDHLVAMIEVEASKDDAAISYRAVEIHHVSDGKLTERWAYLDDPDAVAAFFAG